MPNLRSSPWIQSAPQSGLAILISSNELSNLQLCLWPAALRFRFTPPIRAETRAMPTDRRLRLDDRQSTQHTRVPMIQPGKLQTVDIAKSRILRRFAHQNIELVVKRQDLDFQRSSRSEQSDQPAPNQAAEIAHRAIASLDSHFLASRFMFAVVTPMISGLLSQILCSLEQGILTQELGI